MLCHNGRIKVITKIPSTPLKECLLFDKSCKGNVTVPVLCLEVHLKLLVSMSRVSTKFNNDSSFTRPIYYLRKLQIQGWVLL